MLTASAWQGTSSLITSQSPSEAIITSLHQGHTGTLMQVWKKTPCRTTTLCIIRAIDRQTRRWNLEHGLGKLAPHRPLIGPHRSKGNGDSLVPGLKSPDIAEGLCTHLGPRALSRPTGMAYAKLNSERVNGVYSIQCWIDDVLNANIYMAARMGRVPHMCMHTQTEHDHARPSGCMNNTFV